MIPRWFGQVLSPALDLGASQTIAVGPTQEVEPATEMPVRCATRFESLQTCFWHQK
jgi:hypothetical protein